MFSLKRAAKSILGPRLIGTTRAGLRALRDYPQYLLGHGIAARLRILEFEITYSCNARCQMCPLYAEHQNADTHRFLARRKKEELSTSEIQSVIEQCARLGTRSVIFSGGEPLLRQDLSELIATVKRFGLSAGVITNGSAISDQKARDIVTAGLDWLHVSIDGPGELHDSIRRVPNLFSRIESNLEVLQGHRTRLGRTNPVVNLGCTVSALNQHRLHELVPIAARWQALLIFRPVFFTIGPSNRAADAACPDLKPENWNLPESVRNVDVEALAEELQLVKRLAGRSGVAVSMEIETSIRELRERYYACSHFAHNKCFYPWFAARMNPYGDIYNCSLLNLMGNVREQPLKAIWNSSHYVAFRLSLRQHGLFPQCQRCCSLNPHDVIGRCLPRFSWVPAAAPRKDGLSASFRQNGTRRNS